MTDKQQIPNDDTTLRRINDGLLLAVVLLGLFIALSPMIPEINWVVKNSLSSSQSNPYSAENQQSFPEDNRLVIPSIFVDEPILEGESISVLNEGGTWLRPQSKNPLEQGNTVIVGHRFYGVGNAASSFYHLDKVEVGDKIYAYWEKQEKTYVITEKKIVSADSVDIESDTEDTRLTLYTCTPIWTAKDRLVIIAHPYETEKTEETEEIKL